MSATPAADHFQRIRPFVDRAIQIFGCTNTHDNRVLEVLSEITHPLRDHMYEYPSDIVKIPSFYRFCYSLSRLVDFVPVEYRCAYSVWWYQMKATPLMSLFDKHLRFQPEFDFLPTEVAGASSTAHHIPSPFLERNLGRPTPVPSNPPPQMNNGKTKEVPAYGGNESDSMQAEEEGLDEDEEKSSQSPNLTTSATIINAMYYVALADAHTRFAEAVSMFLNSSPSNP